MFISDFLDICDPVLTFDEFMEGIDLAKYLKNIPVHETGRESYPDLWGKGAYTLFLSATG